MVTRIQISTELVRMELVLEAVPNPPMRLLGFTAGSNFLLTIAFSMASNLFTLFEPFQLSPLPLGAYGISQKQR